MPLINGVKFACNSCIKGHRSSHCNHVERPLFEIRRKGRPVTQCAYCRDLRKTKHVHVKCVCSERKGEAPVTNTPAVTVTMPSAQAATKVHSMPCTCADDTKLTLQTAPSDLIAPPLETTSGAYAEHGQTPVSATPSPESQEPSYSWAWISPRLSNHALSTSSQQNDPLGFVFQKPSGVVKRRVFQNGQPNSPRRRSSVGSAKRAHPPADYPRPNQSSSASAFVSSTTSPTVVQPPAIDIDMALDLESVLSHMDTGMLETSPTATTTPVPDASTADMQAASMDTSSSDALIRELALSGSDALTTLLNSILQKEVEVPAPLPQPAPHQRIGCCGSIAPAPTCLPVTNNAQGESVVITITPLLKQAAAHEPYPSPTTTRVVTCYCGAACSCLGCLVHPSNSFLGHQSFDPYAGISQNALASSSSASSTYSSDDERLM